MSELTRVRKDHPESDTRPEKRQSRKCAPPRLTSALYKAAVASLADTAASGTSSSSADVDAAVIQRIKKCLDRASHPNTLEAEAKAALYLASRLMGQHNVTQTEVLAHEETSKQQQYAGQSLVRIERADGSSKPIRHQGYVIDLACAMNKFFDCKSYSTKGLSSLRYTFYGIAENTVSAAMAFEMAYNLISEWARPYKGNGAKTSYCAGVALGLYRSAKEEKQAEEQAACQAEIELRDAQVKNEEAERQAELGRLFASPKSPTSSPTLVQEDVSGDGATTTESDRMGSLDFAPDRDGGASELCDGESEYGGEADFEDSWNEPVDIFEDLDQQIGNLIKTEPVGSPASLNQHDWPSPPHTPPPKDGVSTTQQELSSPHGTQVKPEDDDEDCKVLWTSSRQLTTFRATAAKIADDFLKEQDIAVGKKRFRHSAISDRSAYKQGQMDSKKIDVHRKNIEDSSK